MIQLSAAAAPVRDVLKRAEKAEKAAISDIRRRAPALIRKATRKAFPGLSPKDAGLVPKAKVGKGSALSYGSRLLASTLTYAGSRHKLTVPALFPFSGERKSESGGLTAYGRMWARKSAPYTVQTPSKRRAPFGTDKEGLFVMASKKRGAESGVPLLFRREPGTRDIAPVVSIATPQAVAAKRAESVWRPQLARLVQERLEHQWQRAGL